MTTRPLLLEIIVQTLADAREAARGGANRVEIVRAISAGGLTPPLSLVQAIAAETGLPLRVMVRENQDYGTSADELPALQKAAAAFAGLKVDGLVIGFARSGDVNVDAMRDVLRGVPDVRVTFHRAFDALRDPLGAIDRLRDVPQIDRILTSGGTGSPAARCERLRAYVERARDRFEIIAGSGVDETALAFFARHACVREVHVGRAAREGGDPDGPVSAARVRRLAESLIPHR